jgi:quercetin dioxygenase-like cupin family protein
MIVRHYTEVAALPVAMEGAENVLIRNLITAKDGAPTFAMRIFDVLPGGHTPLHGHNYEHEILILDGEGEVTEGKRILALKPGSVVFIRPGTSHQFRNPGDKVLRFVCLIPNQPTPDVRQVGDPKPANPQCG